MQRTTDHLKVILRDHRWPLLISLFIALAAWWGNVRDTDISSDQVNIATMLLKEKQPELFSRDLGFADDSAFRFYTPLYRKLTAFLAGFTGGDFLRAPVVMTPFLLAAYLLGAYALFVWMTGHKAASLLAAVLSLFVRKALIDTWGMGGMSSMLPRSVFLAFTPWLVLGILCTRNRPFVAAGFFFAVGLLANMHPVSAFGFAQIVLLTTLASERFAWRALGRCVLWGAAAALPTIGFAMLYWSSTNVAGANAVTYSEIKDVMNERLGAFYPFQPSDVAKTLKSLTVPVALAGAGLWWRVRERKFSDTDRWFVWFAVVTVVVSLGGTAVVQLASEWTGTKPLIFDQVRTLRFIYLPLFVFVGFLLAKLWESARSGNRIARFTLPVAALALCAYATLPLQKAVGRPLEARFSSAAANRDAEELALQELAEWARAHTPQDAVIDCESLLFRYLARRSLTFCRKDGGILIYSGSERLKEWLTRYREWNQLPENDSAARESFARKHGADYLVLKAKQPALTFAPAFQNGYFRIYSLRPNPAQ